MKQYISYFLTKKVIAAGVILLISALFLTMPGCKDNIAPARYNDNDELPLMDYIDKREDLSIFRELIDYVKRRNLLKTAGAYTLFAPTNQAFGKLFQKLSAGGTAVTSIKDKSPEFWLNYFSYHLLDQKYNTNVFTQGPLPAPTAFNKKYLIADIRDSYASIKLNNFATISESNIEMSNGYINILDEVLSPPVESIFTQLQKSGKYNTMLGIFEETGLTRYLRDSIITLIVESDEVLQRNNFNKNTISDLVNWASYHIIPDSGYFLNQLTKQRFYPVYKRNALSFSVDSRGQYFMNETYKFDQSLQYGIDRICANGVYHTMDTVVAIEQAKAATIRFNLYPPGSSYGEQNVFTVPPASIVKNTGTRSYHQNNEFAIVAFDASQIGDYFWFTVPDVPVGKYKIRIIHRSGTRGKFITIYNDKVVKNNIDLSKADGTWAEYDYYIYNDCGVINVEENSDVKITFAITAFASGKVGSYCCDILMDIIELIPEN